LPSQANDQLSRIRSRVPGIICGEGVRLGVGAKRGVGDWPGRIIVGEGVGIGVRVGVGNGVGVVSTSGDSVGEGVGVGVAVGEGVGVGVRVFAFELTFEFVLKSMLPLKGKFASMPRFVFTLVFSFSRFALRFPFEFAVLSRESSQNPAAPTIKRAVVPSIVSRTTRIVFGFLGGS
jgi:hypothetical protein